MTPDPTTVGVIVGRFQVPDLHEGHRYLISYVCERHTEVIIILGAARGRPNNRDPLPSDIRANMIAAAFPSRNFGYFVLHSKRDSYAERSADIDDLIGKYHLKGRKAVIYGSRDSVIQKYKGICETREVPTIFESSATEIRERLRPIHSSDFRAGMIYAIANRQPLAFPAVDLAIVAPFGRPKVILVGKPDEKQWRFPGGFFEAQKDASFEEAAIREGREEVPGVVFDRPTIIGSAVVDDWRYRRSRDRIVTTFLEAKYLSGVPQGGDDVNRAQWFQVRDIMEALVEEHHPLGKMLVERYTS